MDKIDITHPSYYTDGKIEVADFINDKHLDFFAGNAVKYVARAGKKYADKVIEDLFKSVWYVNRKILNVATENKSFRDEAVKQFAKEIEYCQDYIDKLTDGTPAPVEAES